MQEREERVQQQLELKKQHKRDELQLKRDEAAKRIAEALEKYHQLHQEKKQLFHTHQQEALKRAKELEQLEKETLKKQVEDREKKNKMRLVTIFLFLLFCCFYYYYYYLNFRQQRLVDAYKLRSEHRNEIITRRLEKDEIYEKLKEERETEYKTKKFYNQLKKADKQENVERVARINEFQRLQTIKMINESDLRYESMKKQQQEMMKRHNDELKYSLIRKHAINNAMDLMRVTNDYSLLDKLFNENKRNRKKDKNKTINGFEENEGEDARLNQTI